VPVYLALYMTLRQKRVHRLWIVSVRPESPTSQADLDAEVVFQGSDAVAGYGKFRMLRVLKREHNLAGEP
jgi:hypothetical protein